MLYILDTNPRRLADYICDDDLLENLTSACQCLVNGVVAIEPRARVPIQPNTKMPHIAQWISRSRSNYQWMIDAGFALAFEYSYRFNEVPSDQRKVVLWARSNHPINLFENGLQKFPAHSNRYANMTNNTVFTHRLAYVDRAGFEPDPKNWTSREVPEWTEKALQHLIEYRKSKLNTHAKSKSQ